jgi:hypothetical protein
VIEVLEREHRRYADRKEMWRRYWDFYVGGEQLRRNAGLYLMRRQKEPNDVYAERLARAFYENYLGSCIDWYAATVFRNRPTMEFRSDDAGTKAFYGSFVEDCDCRGASLLETARDVFIRTLAFGESYVLIDFPKVGAEAQTRAEEDAVGKSRAYLATFSPLDLRNWKTDARGNFEWVLLKTEQQFQEAFDRPAMVTEERWTYYDRTHYRVYARRKGADWVGATPQGDGVLLVEEGLHGLADVKQVPLVRMSVSDGLWLGNKAALLQQEHFNKANALSWALHMGLFAMPVIYSEREWQQIVGEAYYIQLGPEDKFGWTEPEGKVFQIAADNLDRLKDEIYRVCYLMTQAGGREARHLGQSGESKRRDFAVTHEVLRAYGGTVKSFLRRVLELVAAARKDEVRLAITGMDEFDAPPLEEEVEAVRGLKELGIGSQRLEREAAKRVAMRYLEGASQQTKSEVLDEIERG